MVSSKIVILAVVLMACIIQTQAASRVRRAEDGDKTTDSGFGSELNNFNKIWSEVSKNPTQFFAIFASSLKTTASKLTGATDKISEKGDTKKKAE